MPSRFPTARLPNTNTGTLGQFRDSQSRNHDLERWGFPISDTAATHSSTPASSLRLNPLAKTGRHLGAPAGQRPGRCAEHRSGMVRCGPPATHLRFCSRHDCQRRPRHGDLQRHHRFPRGRRQCHHRQWRDSDERRINARRPSPRHQRVGFVHQDRNGTQTLSANTYRHNDGQRRHAGDRVRRGARGRFGGRGESTARWPGPDSEQDGYGEPGARFAAT